jgi:hypothetical protein
MLQKNWQINDRARNAEAYDMYVHITDEAIPVNLFFFACVTATKPPQ